MACHTTERGEAEVRRNNKEGYGRVLLVGAPNVGKSVLFGLLTGKYATVSNYPGTTVEVFSGNLTIEGRGFHLVDTPGVNSLLPMSEDERVTRDILLAERPELVVQVGDTKNLKRTLALTVQLAEMGVAVVLVLNMADEAAERGIEIDRTGLSKLLGIEVLSTVAPERRGLRELRAAIGRCPSAVPQIPISYPAPLEEYVQEVVFLLPDTGISKRSVAVMALSGDRAIWEWLNQRLSLSVLQEIERLSVELNRKLGGRQVVAIVNETRMRTASEIAERHISRETAKPDSPLAALGRLSIHPFWGLPVLAVVLYLMYEFVGVFGAGVLVDFLEHTIFGKYLNPAVTALVNAAVPTQFLKDMLVGQYGLITMAVTYAIGIVLPITTTFFIAFSILEDSGYLPRLAIMSNSTFKVMGLNGKAVLPMVLGLGCGTMAVMTTRILDTWRDRMIATFLLGLAVPCSAQLGVILGILGGLSAKAFIIWLGILIGVLLLGGWLAAKIVKGEPSEFFLEIPPMRVPVAKNIGMKTWNRAIWYLKEAVPLFMAGTFALFMLDKLQLLAVIHKLGAPLVTGFLGLPEAATDSFLIGFFRRDYGAAGLYALAEKGMLDPVQSLVSIVTITLFVPCMAHFLMMIKERGMAAALSMTGLILLVALGAGGLLNWAIHTFGITI